MTTRTATPPNCSIARTLDLVSDRWSFLILREAHLGTTRFADFRDNLHIAPNILTNRLARWSTPVCWRSASTRRPASGRDRRTT